MNLVCDMCVCVCACNWGKKSQETKSLKALCFFFKNLCQVQQEKLLTDRIRDAHQPIGIIIYAAYKF
jgi:hypothetical protein